MKTNLTLYRWIASIVGVLLIVLVLIGVPLHYGYLISDAEWLAKPAIDGDNATAGGGWRLGAGISGTLGVAHGWLYLLFLIAAFSLARRAKWEVPFTAVTLICGTVPILSFWAERRATRRVRAEHAAELA